MAYTPEQIDDKFQSVLRRIENGESLRNVLIDMQIGSNTFSKWCDLSETNRLQYARACELRAEKMFDDILAIADETSGDIKRDKDGNEYLNQEFVQRSKLRIDARKWQLSKMFPKKYGDSVKLTGDADNPIQSKLTIEILPASGRIASSEGEIDD